MHKFVFVVLSQIVDESSNAMFFLLQACTISACGNFAILGTEGGWIERFNLQSGISRGTYIDIAETRVCAHNGEVVGLACDATNNNLISAGYNGDIKVRTSNCILVIICVCYFHHFNIYFRLKVC